MNQGLPNNIEAEKALIGSVFWSYGALQKACEEVDKDMFYLDSHAKIFEVILELYQNKKPVDINTLTTELVNKNQYDFIIGSTHVVCDGYDLCMNDFFEGKTKREAYWKYFEEVLHNVETYDFFNVYGHIDFINRYGNYSDKTMNYDEFKPLTDKILKVLAEKNKGIEINTSGFRYGLGHTHPQFPIVKRFKELGGRIITVGSDAHRPEQIAFRFDTAYKMLREAGFDQIALFNDRKPEFVKI